MRRFIRTLSGLALGAALVTAVSGASAEMPLAINAARITIAGTSNVHDYTATTTAARVTRVKVGATAAGQGFWEEIQKPGALEAFDITIPAATLKSSKEGLDKNMYKALKVTAHPDIVFRLARMDGAPGALKAVGTLSIAGVDREVTLPLKTAQQNSTLAVSGEIDVLMTDFGIDPPRAMLGMVRADPRIKVTFEVTLALATT